MRFALCLVFLVSVLGLSGKEKKKIEEAEGPRITLDPFKVRSNPISSYALSLRILTNPEKTKSRIFITGVEKDSDAEELGLRAGDEIVSINGVPVENYLPRVTKDSQLGQIFLNRDPGTKLDLEVITRTPRKFTLRAVVPSPFQR